MSKQAIPKNLDSASYEVPVVLGQKTIGEAKVSFGNGLMGATINIETNLDNLPDTLKEFFVGSINIGMYAEEGDN